MKMFGALVVAAFLLVGIAPAQAVTIGIADQKPSMFTDPRFRELEVAHARLSVPFDALSSPWQVAELDAWLLAARAARVTPLVTFARSRIDRRALPKVIAYKRAVRQFRNRYPWVRTFATWNEANHCGEPTCHRPALVAAYFRVLRAECRGCTVLAAELLDMPNMVRWARAFRRALGREPAVWGLHNYIDANRFRTSGTRAFLGAVRGEVWLTEVGGLVRRTARQRVPLNESPAHAARALRWLFAKIVPLSPRITHVFVYHWQASGPGDTWDSALLTPGGRPRAGFDVVRNAMLSSRVADTAAAPPPREPGP